MAKPKQQILVKECINSLLVWTDNPIEDSIEINKVEGVELVNIILSTNPIFVNIDPRYDVPEIADEIRLLLTAEVPDVFK